MEENERLPFESDSSDSSRRIIGSCPKCGSDVTTYSWGWGCIKDKESCGFTISKEMSGARIDEEAASLLLNGISVGPYDFISKEGKPYKAKLYISDEGRLSKEFIYDGEETDYICPNCKQKLKEGKFRYFCSCGLSFSKKILGHVLSDKEIADLTTGKTEEISDFEKDGKSFKAKLYFEGEELKFEFANEDKEQE